MALTRTAPTIKHIRHGAPHTGSAFNRAFNALAGGVASASACDGGIRLSGFEVTDYDPGVSITFNGGAFIHSGLSIATSFRGVIVEEVDSIELTPSELDAGTTLSLWGWVNDVSVQGSNQNAFFEVTDTASPPVAHAVELARTIEGGSAGSFHWQPIGGAGLCEQSQRIDALVSGGGTTRDFVFTAQNYHDANREFAFMAFADFGHIDGSHGGLIPVSGDYSKWDTDNRTLKQGTAQADMLPFGSSMFQIASSPGTYYELKSVKAVWLEQSFSGSDPDPEVIYGSTVALVDGGGSTIVSLSGAAEHDTEKFLTSAYDLTPPNTLAVRILPADSANRRFMRLIILFKVEEP